ncbi:MAG TPA: polyhydroxyalkanoate synthesis regulator DNA-binding domain-containing protein [Tepidisphaeraceae bacterium]|nr:polyhydroxyalkanoate synthesis regulator DNA-binding domain-containing protein [Tepidisphaeraceae bacterium]
MNASSDPDRVLRIRKYPNRRYYDSTRSRHLTLEGMYSAIRGGYDVEVTDSETGRDITSRVLAQILIEFSPAKLTVFPPALFHRLLRSEDARARDVALVPATLAERPRPGSDSGSKRPRR